MEEREEGRREVRETGGDRRLKKSTKKLLTAMYRLSSPGTRIFPARYRNTGQGVQVPFVCFVQIVLVGLDTITV